VQGIRWRWALGGESPGKSFTGENGDGGGFSVLQCERGGAEGKWSGTVFRRERRSVCVHLRRPRERRAQSGGEEGVGGSGRGGDVQSGATGAREAKRRRCPLEEGVNVRER